jgi:hypothetical protein
MIPFNRKVNKVNLTLHFEGQCFVFLPVALAPGCGARPHGVGTTAVESIGCMVRLIMQPNSTELLVAR